MTGKWMTRVALAMMATTLAACSAPPLRGTVAFHERMALPPRALLEVQLHEIDGDDAPRVIAEQRYRVQSQPPFPFVLKSDEGLSRGDQYRVVARIFVEGALWFSNQPGDTVSSDADEWPSSLELLLRKEEVAQPADAAEPAKP